MSRLEEIADLIETGHGCLLRASAHVRLLQHKPDDEDLIARAARDLLLLHAAAHGALLRVEALEEDRRREAERGVG